MFRFAIQIFNGGYKTNASKDLEGRCRDKKLPSLDRKNSIFLKVTKGCTFGHRIDYNGVGVLRGQRPPPGGYSLI